MKNITIIITLVIISVLLCKPNQANSESIFYTFTGPITNVVIAPYTSPPWEWFFSDPTYFESKSFGFIKPQNYGSITHTIEIDMSKEGTWTDSEGVIHYFSRPMEEIPYYYANYIYGSLLNDANPYEFIGENNYMVYVEDLSGYLDIHVSYYDEFITLSNWEHHGAPDPGFGFDLNRAFLIQGGDWVLLTEISNINPVPEPATLFLLAFGLIGVIGLKRKCDKYVSADSVRSRPVHF
jgi:hypothetical protein